MALKEGSLSDAIASHKIYLETEGAEGSILDLRSANLHRANLQRSDLRRGKLQEAALTRADLSAANLQGAALCRANLRNADLQGANLQGANLSRANLQGANLQGANLSRANLRNTIGNGEQVISVQTTKYWINYTYDSLQIGCEQHPISDWWEFDDKAISRMDDGATDWWKLNKALIRSWIDGNPASR